MPRLHNVDTLEKSSVEERREQFGKVLAAALAARGLRQADLAKALQTTQSSVSAWMTGKSEPAALTVFAVEEVLELAPGYLSRMLLYLPLSAVSARPDVEESIQVSDLVDDDSKRLLITAWHTLVSKHQQYLKAVNGGTRRRRTGSGKPATKAAKAARSRR
jgi:transcriptional regulator with XRE-family HTH domain